MPKKPATMQGTKRPKDSDHFQQRLSTWPGPISANFFGAVLIVFAIIFLPVGTQTLSAANNIYESSVKYDSGSDSACSISTSNQGRVCQVTFDFTEEVSGPLYLYYELKNFYQNHRRYYQSLDYAQLQGEVLAASDVSLSCDPLYQNGTLLLNPCGLVANSFFNDVFSINTASTSMTGVTLDDSNIALECDVNTMYQQVKGFQSYAFNASVGAALASAIPCSAVNMPDNCKTYTDPTTGLSYKFSYPNDDTTQYLYETYPQQISPLEGVTNPHFIVWMRTAMFPTFRKIYAKINTPRNFQAGDRLTINVVANFEVDSFNGQKSLLISTLGAYGGKNVFIGQAYITVGALFLAIGVAVLVREQAKKL